MSFLLLLGLAACGGSSDAADPGSPSSAASKAEPSTPAADDRSCPVAVPGTSVAVQNAEGGVALVFTTTGDLADVRRRAQEMARMHNDMHAKMGPLPTGDAAGGGHDHGAHDHGSKGGAAGAAGGEHGAHAAGGGEHAGHAAGGEHAGHAGGMIQIHSHAAVEDLDGGVRVVFHPAPEQIGALRDELAKHAQHLSAGRCGMSR